MAPRPPLADIFSGKAPRHDMRRPAAFGLDRIQGAIEADDGRALHIVLWELLAGYPDRVKSALDRATSCGQVGLRCRATFAVVWQDFGPQIREALGFEGEAAYLRALAPPYDGPDRLLFRAQEAHLPAGPAWTGNLAAAEPYLWVQRRDPTVMLRAAVPALAIISHIDSGDFATIDEYLVDAAALDIEIIGRCEPGRQQYQGTFDKLCELCVDGGSQRAAVVVDTLRDAADDSAPGAFAVALAELAAGLSRPNGKGR
jgi:hypothetical protein